MRTSDPTLAGIPDDYLEQQFIANPDDSGQGYATSLLSSAGRGFASVVPGVVGGVGYLTGSETLQDAGSSIEAGINDFLPVNPAYQEDFAMKAAGAVGQAGSMFATGGAGGLAGKVLATGGKAAKALQAANAVDELAAVIAKGTTLGAEIGALGTGAVQGAREGGQTAEQYDLEGASAYGLILAGAGMEILTEKLPFGLLTETAAAKKLLGQTIEGGGMSFIGDVATEGVEEAASQVGGNLATNAALWTAGSDVQGPAITEGVGEAAALGAVGGATFGVINTALGAGRTNPEVKPAITVEEPPEATFPEVDQLVISEVASPEAALEVTAAVEEASEVGRQAVEDSINQAEELPVSPAAETVTEPEIPVETIAEPDTEVPVEPVTEVTDESVPQATDALGMGEVTGGEPEVIPPQDVPVPPEQQDAPAVTPDEQAQAIQRQQDLLKDASAVLAGEKPVSEGVKKAIPDQPSVASTAKAWEEKNSSRLPKNRDELPQGIDLPEGTVVRSSLYPHEGDIVVTGPLQLGVNRRLEYPARYTGTGRSGSIDAREVSEVISRAEGEEMLDEIKLPTPTPEATSPAQAELETEPVPDEVAQSIWDNLPPIPPDHVRVLHKTSENNVESIKKGGLNYKTNLSATAHSISDPNQIDQVGGLKGQWTLGAENAPMLVFDVPNDVHNQHQGRRGMIPPGLLGPEYIVGVIPRTAPTQSPAQAEPTTTDSLPEEPSVASPEVAEGSDVTTPPVDAKAELPRDKAPATPSLDSLLAADTSTPQGETLLRKDLKALQKNDSAKFKELAKLVGAEENTVNSVLNAMQFYASDPVEQATPKAKKPKAVKPVVKSVVTHYGNVVETDIRPSDVDTALEAEIDAQTPGADTMWVGSREELAVVRPGITLPKGVEGFYNPKADRSYVITDGVEVYESDVAAAKLNNSRPAVEALRRVIRHENIGHRGWGGMPSALRDKWLGVAGQLMSAQDADDLVKLGYSRYSDWRTNRASQAALFEEFIARKAEQPKFADAFKEARYNPLRSFLKDLWSWITGNNPSVDPSDAKLLDLFRDMAKGSGAQTGRVVQNSIVLRDGDSEYMKAVEAGDLETAQRLVDQAARRAGYDSPKVFRKETSDFDVYDPRTKKRQGSERGIIWWTDNQKTAESYSGRRLQTAYLKFDDALEINAYHAVKDKSWKDYVKWAKEDGNDAVVLRMVMDVPSDVLKTLSDNELESDVFGVFDPSQIKSADPVTYDDAGNVIPPSQRFNTASDDIRFSLTKVKEIAKDFNDRDKVDSDSGRTPILDPKTGKMLPRYQKELRNQGVAQEAAIKIVDELGPMDTWFEVLRNQTTLNELGVGADLHSTVVTEALMRAQQQELQGDPMGESAAYDLRKLSEYVRSERGRDLRQIGADQNSERYAWTYAIGAAKSTKDQQLSSTLDRLVHTTSAVQRTRDADVLAQEEATATVAEDLNFEQELLEIGLDMQDAEIKGYIIEINDALIRRGAREQFLKGELKASRSSMSPAQLSAFVKELSSKTEAQIAEDNKADDDLIAALVSKIRKARTKTKRTKTAKTPQQVAETLLAQATKEPSPKQRKQPDPIRARYRELLRTPVSEAEFVSDLTKMGVTKDTATKLFEVAAAKRVAAEMAKPVTAPRPPKPTANQKAAETILNQLSKTHSDTQAWPKGSKKNPMAELYKEHLKEPMDEATFVDAAQKLGVKGAEATKIWTIANKELVGRAALAEEREAKVAAKRRKDLLDLTPKEPRAATESKPRTIAGLLAKARRDLLPDVQWMKLFEHPLKTQKEWRQQLFDKVRADPAFADLTNQEARDLSAELDSLWGAERKKILERELKRVTPSANPEVKKRVVNSMSRLLRSLNNGTFNEEKFREAIAPQFGIGVLSAADLKEISDLAQELQREDITTPERKRMGLKLVEKLQSTSTLSKAEILSNIWVTSVLSGPRTLFDMAFNFLNGIRVFSQLSAAAAVTKGGDFKLIGGAWREYAKTLFNTMGEAGAFIATGDQTLLDATEKRLNAYFGEGVGAVPQDIWETLSRDKDLPAYQRAYSTFLAVIQRAMIAFDHITSTSTAQGARNLAVMFNNETYANGRMPTKEDIANARTRATEIVMGEQPEGANPNSLINRPRINVAQRELLNQIYEREFPGLLDQARDIGMVSAYQNDPSGLGGLAYHTLLSLSRNLSKQATTFQDETNRKLADGEDGVTLRVQDAMAKVGIFMAVNSRNLTGTRFVRFVGNKVNEMLSFVPGVGLTRLAEETIQQNPLQKQLLITNQMVGALTLTTLYFTVLKAAFEGLDDDEEEPPFAVNGPWKPLTPNQRNAMRSVGSSPNTIEFRDKDGNVQVINYTNWPVSGLFATVGNLMDLYRFNRKKWGEKDALERVVSGAVSGAMVFQDLSAISGLVEVIASTSNERDPTEGAINRLGKWAANYAGGFVPRMIKDVDIMMEPEYERPNGFIDYFIKEIPFVRRGNSGTKAYNLLGEPVEINRLPWSRAILTEKLDKPYQVAADLMGKGVFFTAPNPLNRTIPVPGTMERRDMTDDEGAEYVKVAGGMYREFFNTEGDKLLAMDPDFAKKYIDERTRGFRDAALLKVTR